MSDINPHNPSSELSRKIEPDIQKASKYAYASRSNNTKKAYASDWKHFINWCEDREINSMPASIQTVTLYMASIADAYKITSLERRLASISQAHKTNGFESPALVSREPLHSVWSGIVRSKSRKKDKVAPALTEDILLMIEHLPRDLDLPGQPLTIRSLRDKAMLLIGFAGAMRRSELVSLEVQDIHYSPDGIRINIRKSKTDQEGHGQVIGLLYGKNPASCPVRALKAWLKAAGITTGPLFRAIRKGGAIASQPLSGRTVARIIKSACLKCGLSPDLYSGHSLRAGFTTQAARAGKAERIIMRHTRHKSEKMVREYIREGDLFTESPTDALGL